MCDLDSDIAGSSNDTQRIEPKPKTQLSSTVRPVCGGKRNSRNVPRLIATLLVKSNMMMSKTQQVRVDPCVDGSTKLCVLTPKHAGTGRLVSVDQNEEHGIDFRVPGLSHAVVKKTEHLRVQELLKKIESHPHREALHADLQQSNVRNPFSKKSKEIIRELGNVELFELCETIPKVQCSH